MRLFSKEVIAGIGISLSLTSTIAIRANEISTPENLELNLENPEELNPNPEEIITPTNLTIPFITPWRRVRLVYTLNKHQGAVDSVLFTPDSSLLISGGGRNDAQMRIWSLATGEFLTQLRAQQSGILAMAIDPYSKHLIIGGEDSGINVWDWQSGQYQSAILEHDSSITDLEISPDGKTLVSAALDGMKVWDISTSPQSPYYTLTNQGNPVNEIAINPNGYLLASGESNGTVKFWNIRTGTYISEFKPHDKLISGLVFTADGKTLITASHDRTIKIWDLESGQLLNTLVGHLGAIRAIALHPIHPVLASGGNDGIILWNLETGQLTTKLKDHKNWVESLAFSPDGRYLASGSFDASVKVWEDAVTVSSEQ